MPAKSNKSRTASAGGTFAELGVSGLKRIGSAGYVYEEFERKLSQDQGVRVFREMSQGDPIVGAILYSIDKIVRNVDWRVEGPNTEWNDFIESCRQDTSHTWEDFMSEVLSMLVYGWSWFEIVLKRRLGKSDDPTRNSNFSDGKIGWRKFAPRSQDSRFQWRFGTDGGVQAMIQRAPPEYREIEIPIDVSLLFRTVSQKNSPEGVSILRTAYRPWFYRKRIEEIEGIGVERDLAGLPIIEATKEILDTWRSTFIDIVRNVRRDAMEGVLMPLAYDEHGNKLCELRLLSTGGQRQFDTSAIIKRYNNTIATTCLADFILLGQDKVGSFALSSNKTDMFALSLGTYLNSIASVINRFAIPRLLAVNGVNLDTADMPRLVPGDIQAVDLAAMGAYMANLAKAGVLTLPDQDLENHLRGAAGLPTDTEAMQEAEAMEEAGEGPEPAAEPVEEAA